MRRVVAFVVVVGFAVGVMTTPATAQPVPEDALCDVSGPVTIDRYPFYGGGRHQMGWVYTWHVDMSGICTEPSGAEHTLAFDASSLPRWPYLTPGVCNDVGPDDTDATFEGYGYLDGISSFYLRVTWRAAAGVSSYQPMSLSMGVGNIDGGPAYDFAGEGIEANRIFLQCPTTFPHTSNGRFIFTLEET